MDRAAFWVFAVVHAVVTAATLAAHPQVLAKLREFWWVWGVAIPPEAGAIANIPRTLGIMLVIAVFGLPFVLSYTAAIYWVFRGKVRVDKFSY